MSENSTERPTQQESVQAAAQVGQQRLILAGSIVLLVALLTGVVLAVIAMVRNPEKTVLVRDIVIVFMAVESLIIGLALVLLIVQLAKLTALLQNEIKPILDSANDTLNTMRGTTVFLSQNLVKPVTKIGSSLAAAKRALELLRPGRRS